MWQKRTNEVLKVGDRVRLGGREGVITHSESIYEHENVRWDDCKGPHELDLKMFPGLEIFIPEPTISKEARDRILQMFDESKCLTMGRESLKRYLDSMTEKE